MTNDKPAIGLIGLGYMGSAMAKRLLAQGWRVNGHAALPDKTAALAKDYVFEPNAEAVLGSLLPLYINYQIYQMLLEARASEHSARMVAMKAATDNANSMIKDLTLEYNKLRQAAITAELLEITTAMKAME